jgi:hypothetical protein
VPHELMELFKPNDTCIRMFAPQMRVLGKIVARMSHMDGMRTPLRGAFSSANKESSKHNKWVHFIWNPSPRPMAWPQSESA